MKHLKGEGALILTTIIWGGTFVIVKNALADASPMVFISLRFTFATLLLLPFVFKILHGLTKTEISGGIILSLIYFLAFAAQTAGLKFTSATKSGFITGSFILFTPLLQYLFEKKAPGKWNIAGIILIIIGLIFLSSKGTSYFDVFNEMGEDFNVGDYLTLACAFLYAVYVVYLDIISKKARYMPLVFMQISLTAIGGILFALTFSAASIEPLKMNFTGNLITALLYTSILATIITTTLQTKYQKLVTPTKASIIFSFEPIFAALFAYMIIDERLSKFGIIGGIFIFAGLLVSELFDKGKKESDGAAG